jgi:alginate O-acetyltransferase complex protein AlgI
MVFSSITFLFYFLPVFYIIYYLLPKSARNWWVLVASIFFYAWGAPEFIVILILSSILDFYLVRAIPKSNKQKARALLGISLVKNVGLLVYYKYSNFFIENVNRALEGLGYDEVPALNLLLPIGISFYTFQTITYAMDVYRGRHAPLSSPHLLLLYILSFPQLIAGPIVQFNDVADQLTGRTETSEKFLFGFYRFALGLGKKVLIANTMGSLALVYFDHPDLSTGGAWLGILAYTFQIYFDFSGYSDMAIGLGKMMGFDFPENFNNPYASKSITEFWRRWHITLGSWMRQYLYIPLGGNRVTNKGRLYLNLWIVFLISGLWHGASWNFVIWGAFHGFFLVVERLFLKHILDRIGVFAWLWTFLLVVVGWVFFALEDSTKALEYLETMFRFNGFKGFQISNEELSILLLAIFFSFLTLTKMGRTLAEFAFNESVPFFRVTIRVFISFTLIILAASAITTEGFNPFIYFRF